jgi:hypothetical protein
LFPLFATSVVDTGGKFTANVVDAGGNLPSVSTIPVSMTSGVLMGKCPKLQLYSAAGKGT